MTPIPFTHTEAIRGEINRKDERVLALANKVLVVVREGAEDQYEMLDALNVALALSRPYGDLSGFRVQINGPKPA